jgi:hypothetical protein
MRWVLGSSLLALVMGCATSSVERPTVAPKVEVSPCDKSVLIERLREGVRKKTGTFEDIMGCLGEISHEVTSAKAAMVSWKVTLSGGQEELAELLVDADFCVRRPEPAVTSMTGECPVYFSVQSSLDGIAVSAPREALWGGGRSLQRAFDFEAPYIPAGWHTLETVWRATWSGSQLTPKSGSLSFVLKHATTFEVTDEGGSLEEIAARENARERVLEAFRQSVVQDPVIGAPNGICMPDICTHDVGYSRTVCEKTESNWRPVILVTAPSTPYDLAFSVTLQVQGELLPLATGDFTDSSSAAWTDRLAVVALPHWPLVTVLVNADRVTTGCHIATLRWEPLRDNALARSSGRPLFPEAIEPPPFWLCRYTADAKIDPVLLAHVATQAIDPMTKCHAYAALVAQGSDAAPATPVLLAPVRDIDPMYFHDSEIDEIEAPLKALAAIGPGAAAAAPILLDWLARKNTDGGVGRLQRLAVETLAAIRPPGLVSILARLQKRLGPATGACPVTRLKDDEGCHAWLAIATSSDFDFEPSPKRAPPLQDDRGRVWVAIHKALTTLNQNPCRVGQNLFHHQTVLWCSQAGGWRTIEIGEDGGDIPLALGPVMLKAIDRLAFLSVNEGAFKDDSWFDVSLWLLPTGGAAEKPIRYSIDFQEQDTERLLPRLEVRGQDLVVTVAKDTATLPMAAITAPGADDVEDGNGVIVRDLRSAACLEHPQDCEDD